jgi:enoyl-CoA hydratase
LCGQTNLNILNMATITEFSKQLSELAKDDQIDVLIITGQGEKAFSSGADIRELALLDEDLVENYVRQGTLAFQQVEDFPVPVIGVINGFAYGAAFELLLACDLRFMAAEAKIGQPAVKHGLFPPFGGTHRLSQIVGTGRAKEIIFGGLHLSPEECLGMGLVNRVYPRESLLKEAVKFAEIISNNKRYAVALSKQAINLQTTARNVNFEEGALISCLKNEETKKQLLSFFEKNSLRGTGPLAAEESNKAALE